MAFQPFTLSRRPSAIDGITAGMSGFGNALVEAQKAKQDRDQLALTNLRQVAQDKRQREIDFQAALLKAEERKKAGDVEGARAILAPFADSPNEGRIQTREMTAPKPWQANMNSGEYQNAVLDQMGDVLGQNGQQAPGAAPPSAPSGPMSTQPPPFDPQAAGSPDAALPMSQPQQPAQAPGGAPPNPLVAAAMSDQAKKAQMAKFFTGRFNGQQLTFDPEADRADQLARTDQAFAQAGGADGPDADIIRALYPQMRAAGIASGQPLDTKETMRDILGEGKIRRQESADELRQKQFEDRQAQMLGIANMRNDTSIENSKRGANARITAAGVMAQPAIKADNATRGDTSNLDRFVKQIYDGFGGKQALQGMNSLHAAAENLKQTGPNAAVAHRDALVQLAKYFRGTVPTEGEMKLLYTKIGGLFGSIDQFEKNAETGDLSDPLMQNVIQSANVALREAERRRGQLFKAFRVGTGPGTEFENMQPQVNRKVQSYGAMNGLDDVPDIWEGATGGMALGSGTRPAPSIPGHANPAPAQSQRPSAPLRTDEYLKMLGK